MAIEEKSLGLKSGLRVEDYQLHVLDSAQWISFGNSAAAINGFQGVTADRSLFTNKYLPHPRTIAVRIVTNAVAGTRIWGFQMFGKDHRGIGQTEIMNADGLTLAVGPSTTVVHHSKKVWGDIEKIFFGGFSGWQDGTPNDLFQVGLAYTGEQANVIWGSPINISSKTDFLAGNKTSGALTTPVSLDLSTIVVPPLLNAFKLPTSPAIASLDLVTLWIRTGVN